MDICFLQLYAKYTSQNYFSIKKLTHGTIQNENFYLLVLSIINAYAFRL